MFCSDACRKFASRNPDKVSYEFPKHNSETIRETPKSPQLSVKGRTNSTNLINYAAKKTIDVIAHRIMNNVDSQSKIKDSNQKPLVATNLQNANALGGLSLMNKTLHLPEDYQQFLGELTFPFRMLVWGMPGQGKSTFCLQFANALAGYPKVIYVSGEENPGDTTFLSKVKRCISTDKKDKTLALNRLPNYAEWGNIIKPIPHSFVVPEYRHILYDSISVLDIQPDYPSVLAKQTKNPAFESAINHIFISQAQKDGKTYLGPASWGHDVDIIVRVSLGQAQIEKNRFATESAGQIGSTLKVF
jgi:hypothetical protein